MSVRIGRDGTIIRTNTPPPPQPQSSQSGYRPLSSFTSPVRNMISGISASWVICFVCTILFDPVFQGIHRIIRGRVIIGLIWMFTYGLFGVGWIIDVFTMLFKKDITFLA